MQFAGSKSKLRRPRPAFSSWYSCCSCGAIKYQSSSARCSVGAMPSANCADFRSRETTASCPSRVPSLIVASFIGGNANGKTIKRQRLPLTGSRDREITTTSGRCQQRQLRFGQVAPFALGEAERFQCQLADSRAVQRAAMVAGGGQHALDLVILALLQHDFQLVLAALDAYLRRQRRRFIVQLHAGHQQLDQLLAHRLLRRGLVNFRYMTLRRRLRMDKWTIVGHQ